MAHTSSLVFAGIAPHPPIMVPEVGRDACVEVQSSIRAMAELTARVIAAGAETIILISPHAPLEPSSFVAYDGPQLYGDFANFRAPTATVHAELDEALLNEITSAAKEQNLGTVRIKGYDLDHGTAVPLYFLQRNGWNGKVIALGYSFLSSEDHLRFGNCVRAAIEKLGRRVAFIASGDLSHRLQPGAPAGYNPEAHLFDEEVVDAIRSCATSRIVDIDQEQRRNAGECGYRSMLVAFGVVEGRPPSCEVISYEAPFGVGYLVAQLLSAGTEPRAVASGCVSEPGADRGPHAGSPRGVVDATGSSDTSGKAEPGGSVPTLARRTIETFITNGAIIDPPDDLPELLAARAGCFVSIKTLDGDLRGCIGTIDPAKDTLAAEIVTNAISAATHDPRFSPVKKDELPNLKYSVDVLSAPEPCSVDDLDPQIYGVIVEDESGLRRGLLLPNLEGINTAAQQIEIASRKAGIASGTPVKLFRFRAERYSE
jgi:AmmeMemoRadiSam system protein A/AmmeMemoRadiSam system protein B